MSNLTALHGRHDRNFLAWRESVISIDEFHACANQDAPVMRPKRRLLRIDFPKQVANSRAVRNIDIQLAHSEQIAQLSVKLHSHFHLSGCSSNSFRKTPM